MIIEKIFIKQIRVWMLYCHKYKSWLEVKFCEHCGSLNVISEKYVDCKFKQIADFQKNMERIDKDKSKRMLQKELKSVLKTDNEKIRSNLIKIINNK